MEEKQIAIFDEIFGALDGILGDDDTDGLNILGAILAMPRTSAFRRAAAFITLLPPIECPTR